MRAALDRFSFSFLILSSPIYRWRSYLCVDDEQQRSASAEDELGVIRGVEEVDLAGEVPHLESDKRRVGHVVLDDLVGRLEKERLGR